MHSAPSACQSSRYIALRHRKPEVPQESEWRKASCSQFRNVWPGLWNSSVYVHYRSFRMQIAKRRCNHTVRAEVTREAAATWRMKTGDQH